MMKDRNPVLVNQRVTVEAMMCVPNTNGKQWVPATNPKPVSGVVVESSGGTVLVKHSLWGKVEIDEYHLDNGMNTAMSTDHIKGW